VSSVFFVYTFVEAVGLWDAGFSAFQALARQIHSLPLVLPMLLPGLWRRGLGARWSRKGSGKHLLKVVETAVQRRHLPGKEEVRPEGSQSKAQSQDEGEHGPGLEAGLLLEVPDRLPRMVSRHLDRPDRSLDGFLNRLFEVLLHDLPDAGGDVLAGLLAQHGRQLPHLRDSGLKRRRALLQLRVPRLHVLGQLAGGSVDR
jgi:hypothetical protein